MKFGWVYDFLVNLVFWSTIVSAGCALLDAWLLKWVASYAKSKYCTVVRAIEDLCDNIGNVFKDKVAPRKWLGEPRREDESK